MRIIVNGKSCEAALGEPLSDVLRRCGILLQMPCGGRGKCGKCLCRVISGEFSGDSGETVRACRTYVLTDAEIEVREARENTGGQRGVCDFLVVDIGTTTVELYGVKNGKLTERIAVQNPQSVYGADVLSRITAAKKYGIKALSLPIRRCVAELCESLCADKPEVTITGNTAMLHFFCGESTDGLGCYPFTPSYSGVRRDGRFTLLASASGFVGADAVCGVRAAALGENNGGAEILCDLGTNCEMAIAYGGKIICTSAAAGPCLEGAETECGMGAFSGAVTGVRDNGRALVPDVLGGTEPVGLSASGLIDLIACLVRRGIIGKDGSFTRGRMPEGCRTENGRFYLSQAICVSERDIQSFLYAKSAVYSGISALVRRAGIAFSDVSRFYIAGNLGLYMNVENAAAAGLIPVELAKVAVPIGNAAAAGAAEFSENPKESERLAARCECFDLSLDTKFQDDFITNLKIQ